MSLPLYQRVALKRDLPEHNLQRGDVAILVDAVPHPQGGEPGSVLEVFNALGESIAVVAVLALADGVLTALQPRLGRVMSPVVLVVVLLTTLFAGTGH